MPKQSLEGSLFPDLEQDRRSTPHPHRAQAGRISHSASSNKAENSEKTEKLEESER